MNKTIQLILEIVFREVSYKIVSPVKKRLEKTITLLMM
jgi:hypothetical protein